MCAKHLLKISENPLKLFRIQYLKGAVFQKLLVVEQPKSFGDRDINL